MSSKECLSAQVLGGYAAGTLSAVDAETIESHLDECGGCLARLDELASQSEPLVDALRGVSAAVPQPTELAQAVAAILAGNQVREPKVESPSAAGTVVGGYRIVGELGRGGMGRVYRAVHPRLDQEVALKVLRPGMDSAPILARFEAERQALALMDHPHIARVSDGGVTDDGQPFFVMELVRGGADNALLRRTWSGTAPSIGTGDRRLPGRAARASEGSDSSRPQTVQYPCGRIRLAGDAEGHRLWSSTRDRATWRSGNRGRDAGRYSRIHEPGTSHAQLT